MSESINEWQCPICTYINAVSALKCDICEEIRKTEISDTDYDSKLEHFQAKVLKEFIDLNGKFSKSANIHFENVMYCYTHRRAENLSLSEWYRLYYPSRKNFSIISDVIEEMGHHVPTNRLDRLYNNAVKAKNESFKSYFSNQGILLKLSRAQEILDIRELNELNVMPKCISDNVFSRVVTDKELWQFIIDKDTLTDFDKRMIMTEFDLYSMQSLDLLITYMDDEELGVYLKEACLNENVKLRYLKQAIDEDYSISSTLNFLKNKCLLCEEDFPIPEMCDLMTCAHSYCKECTFGWLKETIESKYPCKWNCPSCDDNKYLTIDKNMYYSQLRRLISTDKTLISIFELKLLEEQLMKSENFHWCANEECTNGFEAEALNKIQCTSCKAFMCVKCNRMWQESHEGKTCQEFELWMLKNDPNLSNLLKNIGIECPNCGMRYALAAGGCLHFDCKPCGVKFCGGCDQLFVDNCGKPNCAMDKFHAHHPRNCLYFLRDYAANALEKMLKEFDYPKLKGKPNKQCGFMITTDKLKDVECDKDVYATTGMCETHYKEYLVQFINRYQIDPANFVDANALNLMLFQMVLPGTVKLQNEKDDEFLARLKKMVKDSCFLYVPKGLN